MDSRYAEVKALLADSTACRLLRSERAALIISFFDEVFGSGGQLMLPESAVVERLTAFIERVNADNDSPVTREPRALIKNGRQIAYSSCAALPLRRVPSFIMKSRRRLKRRCPL